jgi:hypothetical protein
VAGAHAGGALGQGALSGDPGGREARRQRVGRQDCEDLGCGDGGGGEGGWGLRLGREVWWYWISLMLKVRVDSMIFVQFSIVHCSMGFCSLGILGGEVLQGLSV